MLRHQGGEHVKAGFYIDVVSWQVHTISGTDGGRLPGGESTRFLRVPTLGMLVFAPLMGALFAIFLPFIGIFMVAQYLTSKGWTAVKRAAHATVVALGPAWQPSTAHLTGTPAPRKQGSEPAAGARSDERLQGLEREIAEREKTKSSTEK
jgi:hypothetical protein